MPVLFILPALTLALPLAAQDVAAVPGEQVAEAHPVPAKQQRKIYLRVTLGKGYQKPVQIHVFAAPLLEHYAISKEGIERALDPSPGRSLLRDGDRTPWCPLALPEQETLLMIAPVYLYSVNADRFDAVVEFATAPSAEAVVKTIRCRHSPSTLCVIVPARLDTPEDIARLRSDRELAHEVGAIADRMTWPTKGETPALLPFFVTMNLLPDHYDQDVLLRELRTVRHFGFNGVGLKSYGGLDWHRCFESFGLPKKYLNGNIWFPETSFSNPDLERMKSEAANHVAEHRRKGLRGDEITYINLGDEPLGEPLELLHQDAASVTAFRAWMKSLGKTPGELGAGSWEQVRPVTRAERETQPALFYFSQRFRARALGTFLAVQKQILSDAWQTRLPVACNFSDGAVYYANFYVQGVDYFEILHGTDQNAVWGENWANGSSSFECGTYNAQLLRDAARRRGQEVGSYLIVCDGRTSLDIKLNTLGLVSRGAKCLEAFYYGATWGGREKGMLIQAPQAWYGMAEVLREVGAVEEWLLEAKPRKAQTALLYASSSDIWTLEQNHAFGFDRMHTWMALTHAQIPVDIVHESEVAENFLRNYKVCYLCGPNLTSACAGQLKDWVHQGGTLVLTAAAASRDEYNRPGTTIEQLLPLPRERMQQFEPFQAAGRGLSALPARDIVRTSSGSFEVLSVKQGFQRGAQGELSAAQILGVYADGAPAIIRGKAGKGTILCYGFLPALHYIKSALVHRSHARDDRTETGYNPWEYPADVRDFITAPAREAAVERPIECSVSLVDATYLECGRGILIPLANHTRRPIDRLTLTVQVEGEIAGVVSIHQGPLDYQRDPSGRIRFSLPLDSTDFVEIAVLRPGPVAGRSHATYLRE